MNKNLTIAGLIQETLHSTGQTKHEFVLAMGYANVGKGLNVLESWQRGHRYPRGGQIEILAGAVGVTKGEIERIIEDEQKAVALKQIQKRAKDSKYYLIIRYAAAIYARKVLPSSLTEKEALEIASKEARTKGFRCCLNTKESKNIWLDKNGEIECTTQGEGPAMNVGGKRFTLPIDGV